MYFKQEHVQAVTSLICHLVPSRARNVCIYSHLEISISLSASNGALRELLSLQQDGVLQPCPRSQPARFSAGEVLLLTRPIAAAMKESSAVNFSPFQHQFGHDSPPPSRSPVALGSPALPKGGRMAARHPEISRGIKASLKGHKVKFPFSTMRAQRTSERSTPYQRGGCDSTISPPSLCFMGCCYENIFIKVITVFSNTQGTEI